jgi:hypothetical protein
MTATDAFLSFCDHLKETVQGFEKLPAGFLGLPLLLYEDEAPKNSPFLRVHQLDTVPERQGWYGTVIVQVDVVYPKAKGVPASLLCSQMVDMINRAYECDKIGTLIKCKYEAGLEPLPVGSYRLDIVDITTNKGSTPSPAITHLTFELVTNI